MGIWLTAIAIALSVVSFALQALTAKKPSPPTNAVASGLEDFDIPQIDEGTGQAIVFGDVWIEDWQVLWYGNYRVVPITSSVGGSSKK